MLLCILQSRQLLFVQKLYHAPGQLHHALALEIAEHPGDYLPVSSQVVGDGLVGDIQPAGTLNHRFFQEKGGHPPVHTLPHDLLHEPHDLGKPGGHDLVGVVGGGGGLLQEPPVKLRGNHPERRVLLRLNGDVKLCAPQDAGGGKQADIPVKQAVDSNLPALVGRRM